MNTRSARIKTLALYFGLSLIVHLLVVISLGRFGSYSFASPVNPLQAVMVDLTKPDIDTAAVESLNQQTTSTTDDATNNVTDDANHALVEDQEVRTSTAVVEKDPVEPKSVDAAVVDKTKTDSFTRTSEPTIPPQLPISLHTALAPTPPPLRTASEFLASKSEKLSYLISLRGIPVGSVELEAKNENDEVHITLRTKSNAALSGIYSVDNVMETRHLAGNFIITKIRQHEGSFSSDIGFTIFLRDKRVFWIDRIRNRYLNETIPNSEVLDTLSSFYYLRNRSLQVGKTEILHIYDGDIYAPVPIEVLRQEEVRLRNLKKVDSLLLRHVKQKGGIFRKTGDMMIWLTNDENKVPVKLETTTPFGKVTVELVASETQRYDNLETQNSSR